MYLPKSDIYTSLKKLNYYVSQRQPPTFNDLPANLDLDNNILSQDLEVIIDIWADESVEASKVLSQVEEIMRQNNYKMSFSNDVPNSGNLYHIYCRFTKLI